MRPGTYILLLRLRRSRRVRIGALGSIRFPAGSYLYIGSALGGLEARLRRHARREKSRHWHIDYLRRHAELVEAWSVGSRRRLECRWAAIARRLPGAEIPVRGFGSSDCACAAHLVRLGGRDSR